MHAFSKILVPTDFSPVADRALDYAMHLAATLGAKVVLLHVLAYPYDWYYWEAEALDGLRHEVEETALRKLRGLVPPEASVAVRPRLDLHSDVASTVLRVAEDEGASLIVMGTHGWAEERTALGSVAAQVTRRSTCPVLSLDERATAEQVFPRVLVPVDLSEPAAEALRVGVAFAAALGGRVEVLHVVPDEPFDPAFLGGEPEGASDPPLAAQQTRAVERWVERTVGTTGDAQVPIDVSLASGDLVDEALRVAEDEEVSLIVLGISRDTARRHKAEELALRTPCPVVAVGFVPNLAAAPPASVSLGSASRSGQHTLRAG